MSVPWAARRSNQSILKYISAEYSLEGLMLKVKLQSLATWCKELTHWKRPWPWERLKAGEGDDRRWDGWIVSPTRWTWVRASSESCWRTGKPGMLQSMGLQRVGHDWVTELTDWFWLIISRFIKSLLFLGKLSPKVNPFSLLSNATLYWKDCNGTLERCGHPWETLEYSTY